MKYLLSILCLSILISEDIYPNFTDITKQLEFEKKRIYIEDKSGERMTVTGGESYTALANPLGYLILDQDPDYISKNKPIETEYEYWSEFNIIRNAEKLSEIEFLKVIGLPNEANEIFKNYTNELNNYEEKSNLMIINKVDYRQKNIIAPQLMYALGGIFSAVGLCASATEENDFTSKQLDTYLAIGVLSIIGGYLIANKEYTELVKKYPNLSRPILKQQFSNGQIKSFADSYNRKVYDEIKNQ